MSDSVTTVGEFDLPDCAPPGAAAIEFSNDERTDRIIIANIEPLWSPHEGAEVDFDLYDDRCQQLDDFIADYWEEDIRDEIDLIIENWI